MTGQPIGPLDAGALRAFVAELESISPRQGRFERSLRLVMRAWSRLVAWHLEVVVHAPLPERDGVPGAGSIVVAAPHRAWVEPFLLLAAWPSGAARLVWLADGRTITRSWWRRYLLPRVGVLPIDASIGGPPAYATLAAAACARGFAVAVFPEVGPPSLPDKPRRISPGFAFLALRAGAPVIPVIVGGTHRIVRGSRFSLDFLPAIDVEPMLDPFTPAARVHARDLWRRYEELGASLLPERTAAADAEAPKRERWRWLATLFH
jgi:1-acyl-sn-glycerol-3-phosphate acyltransferase